MYTFMHSPIIKGACTAPFNYIATQNVRQDAFIRAKGKSSASI
jgi:hypothetical protein